MNEVKVLQRLKHEHIVAYKDSFVSDEEKLCIVMEWASGGDLASLISRKKKTGKRFSETEIITILYQICSALVSARRVPARPIPPTRSGEARPAVPPSNAEPDYQHQPPHPSLTSHLSGLLPP